MRIIGNDPSVPRQTHEVASGTLPNGKPVVINADGTVSSISETAAGIGSAVTFESAQVADISIGFDPNASKVVIAYKDQGNSSHGTAVVGTVSGTSISFGTPVVFEASELRSQNAVVFDPDNNKIVICYSLTGSAKAIVGTVSGTSISFGTAVQFEASSSDYLDATYDTNENRVVIAYRDDSNSRYGTAVVGAVSGTSLSFGTPVVFESENSRDFGIVHDSYANRVVVSYMDVANNFYGTAIVGTVDSSNNSISFGSATVFNNTGYTFYNRITFDSTNNKVVIIYKDDDDSDQGTAIVGTTGASSISFGSEVHFNAAKTEYMDIVFDSSAGKVIIVYEDDGNSSYGTLIVGTVSGTSISFGSEVVFEQAESQHNAVAYDSTNNKTVIAYTDIANSEYGTSIVYAPVASTNVTSENYIGISRSGAASGAGAIIDTQGAIADVPETIYEIVSASYDSVNFSVSGQDADPYGLFFRSDGAKMYVAGDTGNDINEYNLSTPWTVSSASYSQNFSVASQESAPSGVFFKTDGTKMFVVGTATDTVYEYALSSAWDVSSASYGSVSFSVGSQDTVPTDLAFNPDGTKMFILGKTGDNVYEYALSSAWVVSSASYTRSFSISSQETGPQGLFFSEDGLNMFVLGGAGVNKYVLSSAFDISSASHSQAFSVSSQENDPQALFFKSDGTKMYVLGSGSDTVYQYSTSVSLTPAQSYFVQNDGTLGTTAADPSVFAGTAVSATKLIVKG